MVDNDQQGKNKILYVYGQTHSWTADTSMQKGRSRKMKMSEKKENERTHRHKINAGLLKLFNS